MITETLNYNARAVVETQMYLENHTTSWRKAYSYIRKNLREYELRTVMKKLAGIAGQRGIEWHNANDAVSVVADRIWRTYRSRHGATMYTYGVKLFNQHGWKVVARQSCPVSMVKGAGNGDGTFRVAGVVELDGERQDGRSVADTFEAEGHNGIEATLLPERNEEAIAIATEDDETAVSNAEMLEVALGQLPAKLAYAVRENYVANRTLEDIGRELGITKAGVSLQVKKGLAMLRATLTAE
jgi:hypothetical protein